MGVLFGAFTIQAQDVEITFRVDMSEFTGTIDASGMHLAGSFPTNTWTPSARPMTDEGGGIWSYVETVEANSELEYKFVLGNDWAFGDENVGGLSCSAPFTSNRALTVPSENTVLDAVCWNSCNPCAFVAPTVEVTFQVDMSQQTIDFDNGGVSISGTFNSFDKTPMDDQGNGVYAVTIALEENSSAQYKFRNGDEFENPQGPCASGDFGNRVVNVGSSNEVLPVVCYASCDACTEPGEFYDLTFQVDASQIDIDSLGLFIAGTFNGFTPTAMNDEGDDVYSFTASVEEGSTVLWKYLNGDSFDNVETVPEECGQDDGFGGFNRVLTGPSENTVLDVVCFGSCTECSTDECLANGGTLVASGTRSFCVGTGTPVGISVSADGAVGTNQLFALINASGDVVATRSNNSNFNLDVYPPGNYSIRYIRFEDDVSLAGITNVSQASSLEGCFSLASNAINLFLRDEPDGGTLTAASSTTVCAGVGPAVGIEVSLSGAVGDNSVFGLVEGAPGTSVLATSQNPVFNLNNFAPGTYRVFHLSYQQGVNLQGVTQASDLQGCFDLSNAVAVNVVTCLAPELSSFPNPSKGSSYVSFSNPNEEMTTLEVYDMNGRLVEQLFNQMSMPEQEYRIEFDGSYLPNGVYIYRLTTQSEVVTDKFILAR